MPTHFGAEGRETPSNFELFGVFHICKVQGKHSPLTGERLSEPTR